MGVIWTVWPLDDEMRDWLVEEGVEVPDADSRFPTGSEIKQTLAESGLKIDIYDNGPQGRGRR